MGLDGGCITGRSDMVFKSNKKNLENQEKDRIFSESLSYFLNCSLSGKDLTSPILISKDGRLFNKEDFLIAQSENQIPNIFSKYKNMKGLRELDLLDFKNLINYKCPLSQKTPNPGTNDLFTCIFKCGHIFHKDSLKKLNSNTCPHCGKLFFDRHLIDLNTKKQKKFTGKSH